MYLTRPLPRLLYLNLYNSTGEPGTPDHLRLWDGDVFNTTARVIGEVVAGRDSGRQLYTTKVSFLVGWFVLVHKYSQTWLVMDSG